MKQFTVQPNARLVLPEHMLNSPEVQITLHANAELIVLDDALRDKIAKACADVLMHRSPTAPPPGG